MTGRTARWGAQLMLMSGPEARGPEDYDPFFGV
jgi:hypothetical protein